MTHSNGTTHSANSGRSSVILRGVGPSNLEAVVRELMEFCRWDTIVKPNSKVVVKPNLCTAVADKAAMANTDPQITEAVCKILLERTPNVCLVEADGLRQTAWEAYEASGYNGFASRLGIKLVNLSEEPCRPLMCPPAGEMQLPNVMLDADVFITLPVLKTHSLTYFTGALKNQWGCVPQYNRILLHRYLDELLGTLHRILKPSICLMDGIIGMEGRGPANGKPRRLDVMLASQDGVALDATAMRLVGLEPTRSKHIVLAAAKGLGRMGAAEIDVDGDWERHATQFEPAILDKAQAAMNYMSRYKWFVRVALENDYIFYPVRSLVQLLRVVGVVEGR